MGSKIGVQKIAAKRLGISFEEYLAHIDAGEKWCHKCTQWKQQNLFSKDRHRGDGLKAICRECEYPPNASRPGLRERRQKFQEGLAYCRLCQKWLPKDNVLRGLCKPHKNETDRTRYATDVTYRNERKQHAHSRKRGIEPIPSIGQDHILEEFHGKCAYCSEPATTWDHIYPIVEGGITTPSNVVPACMSCNSSKKGRNVFEWATSEGRILPGPLFDRLILAECSMFPYDMPLNY